MSQTDADLTKDLIDQSPPYRELTLVSVLLGVMIGSIMTASFVYIALKLGFGLGGSTVAAILGFAFLKTFVSNSTIIENNINQTIASGVNNASAGVVFTLPALFLMGASFSPWTAILSAIAGTFLGIVIIIPLRKQMIEFERLRFPSGIAVSSLLKSPGAGRKQARLLIQGFLIATAIHIAVEVTQVYDLDLGAMIGLTPYLPFVLGISFASIGAGLLAGSGGLPFVAGAVLAWWIISPLVFQMDLLPSLQLDTLLQGISDIGDHASQQRLLFDFQNQILYQSMLRPVGIGILIGGALSGVIASFPALKSAIKSLSMVKASSSSGPEELNVQTLIFGLISAVILLFLSAYFASDLGVVNSIIIALVSLCWLILAGLVVAQATGMTDISPLSGMSLIGITLMYFLSGGNEVVAVILGVAVCIGIGQCADMMSDLKAGHLIGAQPRTQQLAQLAVAWVGVPVAVGVLYLLWGDGNGFGPGTALTAPQGEALEDILTGLSKGEAPLDKYTAGAGIGLVLGVYPISGLGVLIGLAMYLPFSVTLTYAIGCLTSIYLEKKNGNAWIADTIVPLAAGFIIGEALTSITAILITLDWSALL